MTSENIQLFSSPRAQDIMFFVRTAGSRSIESVHTEISPTFHTATEIRCAFNRKKQERCSIKFFHSFIVRAKHWVIGFDLHTGRLLFKFFNMLRSSGKKKKSL